MSDQGEHARVRPLRLYRGLRNRYRPEDVGKGAGVFARSDFTDCPFTALQYARSRNGVVLVVEAPPDRVWEELWLNTTAKRFSIWGKFDKFLVAVLPAKELRAQVRRKGIVTQSEGYKSRLLGSYIDERAAAPDPASDA